MRVRVRGRTRAKATLLVSFSNLFGNCVVRVRVSVRVRVRLGLRASVRVRVRVWVSNPLGNWVVRARARAGQVGEGGSRRE